MIPRLSPEVAMDLQQKTPQLMQSDGVFTAKYVRTR